MPFKKWMTLMFYIYLFFSLGYFSYSDFTADDNFYVLWGIAALAIGYQIFRFFVANRKNG